MIARPLSPEARDLEAVERVRLALLVLAPLVEAARKEAFDAGCNLIFCRSDAERAGAPDDICGDCDAAHRTATWRRDRLVGAVNELDGWMQAVEAADGRRAA